MKKILKRYKGAVIIFVLMLLLLCINADLGIKSFESASSNIKQMLILLPPIFILMGLMDVWVSKEIMIKYMGEKSGMKGVVLAFLLGSFTSGPLYAAFPVVSIFMKKGVKFSNILIFLGAWSTTKIPMLLFEGSNLGWTFTITRLIVDIPGIIIMAKLIVSVLSKEEINELYKNAETTE